MWNRCARIAGACLCAFLATAHVLAQPETRAETRPEPSADGRTTLGLAEALERTITRHPDLNAAGFEVQAAEGRLRQAGLAPNPEVGVTVEDAAGTDRYSGFDSAETTVTLGWVLQRGVREKQIETAREGLSLQNVDVEIARLDTAAETARRFVSCLAFQARLEHAADAVRLAEETVRQVRERIAAGRAPVAELARAEANLARAELRREDYEHELLSAYHRLSAQWGETMPDFSAVGGDVRALPRPASFEELLAGVDANPELSRFVSQRRVDESRLRLAEARARPSWGVYTGFRRFEGSDDFALVGGITIPLPLRDRNQGRIAEMRAQIARTEAATAAARIRIETELFVLYQELRHNLQLAQRLDEDVIPLTQDALADTRSAYELGRYGYFEWRAVQAELLEATSDRLEASIDAHRIIIEIERLTGMPLAFAGPAQGERP